MKRALESKGRVSHGGIGAEDTGGTGLTQQCCSSADRIRADDVAQVGIALKSWKLRASRKSFKCTAAVIPIVIPFLLSLLIPIARAGDSVAEHNLSDVPRLIAGSLSHIGPWCSNNELEVDENGAPLLVNLNDKTLLPLINSKMRGNFGGCSPSGRWAVVDVTGGRGDPEGTECTSGEVLPTAYLWDIRSRKRYLLGEGYFEFSWKLDADVLLYRRSSDCDFDRDERTILHLPQSVRGLKLVSVHELVQGALKGAGAVGLPDRLLIASTVWIDASRLLVHSPEKWGSPSDGGDARVAQNGVIVVIHVNGVTPTEVEQINPSGFHSSWKLTIAQLATQPSDGILAAVNVDVVDEGKMIVWRDKSMERGEAFVPARFCEGRHVGVHTGDVERFCEAGKQRPAWSRLRRGNPIYKTLVAKQMLRNVDGGEAYVTDLFVIDNDHGEYFQ